MRKTLWLWLLLFCVTLIASGCGEKSVAEVNGVKIGYEDFSSYWENLVGVYKANDAEPADELKETVVKQLVYDELLAQTAADLDCVPSKAEDEAYFEEQLAAVYGSTEAGLAEIEGYGLEEDFFRHQYHGMLLGENITTAAAAKEGAVLTVSEEEAQELYDADPTAYNLRRISHILVAPYAADGRDVLKNADGSKIYTKAEWAQAETRAQELIAQLEEGASFSSLALKYSDEPVSATIGGRIDEALSPDNSEYSTALIDAAFGLTAAGTYTKTPVKTDAGYEIVYCEEALSADDVDAVLAYIRDEQEALRRTEFLTDYMSGVEQNADIVYYLDEIE